MVMDEIFGFFRNYSIWICVFIIVILLIIIVIQYCNLKQYNKERQSLGNNIPREKFNSLFRKKDQTEQEKNDILIKYNSLRSDYESICLCTDNYKQEINKLKAENARLNRTIDELNEIIGRPQASPVSHKSSMQAFSAMSDFDENSKEPQILSKDVKMFASFPRLAENRQYFSELTDREEGAYFELMVSKETGKATFKPINFLQIRNYDSAMSVIQTEGAKPNVATNILSVKPGTAHIEDDVWIIDSLVKIQLV